jgi:uncharacterized phage-associated protein
LDEAADRGIGISNLSLQKILYFVHGKFLVEEGTPLLAGSFEAWKYGPVNLPVYEAFKHFGADPITDRAMRRDIRLKQVVPIAPIADQSLRQRIANLAIPYLELSAGRLVDLSHAKHSPWDVATQNRNGQRSFGLRITNENISQNFRHHKVTIRETPEVGEPNEESSPY